jgi:hypothetical protein
MRMRGCSGTGDGNDFREAEALTKLLGCSNASAKQENLAVALQSGMLLKLLLMTDIVDVPAPAVAELLSLCTLCLQQLSIRDAFSAQV